MALVLSEAEIQLAELVSENFTEYQWAVPHLAELRERRQLFLGSLGKKRDKHGVHKRYGKILVYCLPLLLLVLERDIYSAVKLSSQVVGVGAAVVAHKALGSPISQFEKIEPAVSHVVAPSGSFGFGCLNLTVNEMARWQAAGLREPYQFCS